MVGKNNNYEEPSIDKPHDKLIRRILGNEKNIKDVVDAYLPREIKELLDLTRLERQPDTFVDSKHRIHEVDVLFKTRCKNTEEEAYIWILIEQQSHPDVWMPLRMFCYIAAIWDNLRKKIESRAKTVKIPFIYPLIISNASKPYPYSLNLKDMLEPKAAQPLFEKLFTTPIQMIDLAAITDKEMREKLQEHVRAQALLLSMKHIHDKNLQDLLETILIYSFQELERIGAGDDVADLLYYLYNEGNLVDEDNFLTFLNQKFSKGMEERVMSLGRQAIKQATDKAVQQNRQQIMQEVAQSMLNKKMNINSIAEVTGLSIEEIRRLAMQNQYARA